MKLSITSKQTKLPATDFADNKSALVHMQSKIRAQLGHKQCPESLRLPRSCPLQAGITSFLTIMEGNLDSRN